MMTAQKTQVFFVLAKQLGCKMTDRVKKTSRFL